MPCPPQVPISIIPPVSEGVAPILWRNGNQITRLNIPLNPSFLIYDGSKTRWGDGSAQAPVYLPNIQEVNSPAVTYVAGITSTGQLVKTLGVSGTGLVGGSAGSVVYQTAPSATGFTAVGTSGKLLSSNGASAPTWLNQSSIAAGSATNIASGVAGAVPYQTAPSTTGFTAAGTTGQVLLSNGTSAPTWSTNIAGQAGSVADGSVTPAKLSTGGPSWNSGGDLVITSGTLTINRTNADYNVISLVNSSGVQVQLNANGNSEGNLRTTTNHPLSLSTNSVTRLNISTTGVIDTQGNPITNCPTTAKAYCYVTAAGALTAAFGVSASSKTSTGVYSITTTTGVNSVFVFTTSQQPTAFIMTGTAINSTTYTVRSFNTAGAAADSAFYFVIVGS
jgi:hypothetical protein